MAAFAAARPTQPAKSAYGGDCVVEVSGYTRIRNGKVEDVSGYARSNPYCNDNGKGDGDVTAAMARRPDGFEAERGRGGLQGGGPARGQGGGTLPSQQTPAPEPSTLRLPSPPAVTPTQNLRDVLAPGGRPIGQAYRGVEPDIRTFSGGETGGRAMFEDMIRGRGAIEATPPGYPGRMVRLSDGSLLESVRP